MNGIKVSDMELDNGDEISLVNGAAVPQTRRASLGKFIFTLRKIKSSNSPIPGEVLVSTKTEPIVISDDEEDEPLQISIDEEEKKKIEKFADDYEVGESSSKSDPDSDSRPSTPPRNDPVSKVSHFVYSLAAFYTVTYTRK